MSDQAAPVSPETDHLQVFLVMIPTFGDPEKEQIRSALQLARALHYQVKPGCLIAAADVDVIDDGTFAEMVGPWLGFDPKGDDQGNHGPEHSQPLVEVGE